MKTMLFSPTEWHQSMIYYFVFLCQADWFIITVWKSDHCNFLFDKFMFPRCCYTFLFLDWGTQWDILLNKFGKIPGCCDLEVKWYGIKNTEINGWRRVTGGLDTGSLRILQGKHWYSCLLYRVNIGILVYFTG